MTRKHFRAIAEAVRNIEDATTRQQVAKDLAAVCASANPNFKRQRFMEACNCEAWS